MITLLQWRSGFIYKNQRLKTGFYAPECLLLPIYITNISFQLNKKDVSFNASKYRHTCFIIQH